MKKFFKLILLVACVSIIKTGHSQTISPELLKGHWKASWITVPDEPEKDYGVYYFRKNVQLSTKPTSFIVHVSADNRYKLYVNQTLVSLGPARGDTYYWNYETVDLASYLKAGNNSIAALVWNEGDYRPEAQISLRTGFIMQGNTANEAIVNTGKTWKCIRDKAYQPLNGIGYHPYYVAGPGELVNMNNTIKGWDAVDFDDSAWKNAIKIDAGNPKGTVNAFGWMLVPSSLPPMELKYQRIATLRKAEGVTVSKSFPAVKTAVTIPANTSATLLLDQTFLTNAFVTLNFSKGKNASVKLTYAEAMFTRLTGREGTVKGNRNDVEGKLFAGRRDSIISDGSANQTFTTLAWRTYRYIQVKIKTGNEPLVIDDMYGTFTGYPFQLNAKLETGNPEMQKMLDIGWRTARLCAGETYTDCPYYEQLQYVGDSRIQALVSYYNSGDDRLARNAINQMDQSRIAEGLTLSRHPSFSPQIISTFSLWYIGMLHDYWMYRPDSAFVKNKLEGVRAVLSFFSKYQQADGSLKDTPYWTFVDWVNDKGWDFGEAPIRNGNSAVLDLQLMWAYNQAAEMEAKMGMQAFSALYKEKATQLKATIQKRYWDAGRQLYSDTEDKQLFSQHTNTLAVLTGMIGGADETALCKKLLTDTTLTKCTIYFKYYLHQALIKGGLGNDYLKWLDIWRKNIDMGLTTWAEISDLEHNRSDCHAWGASPNIEFYRTILGVDSDEPGFAKVKIEPHLGDMKNISGEIPHPNGKITVKYQFEKGKWNILINLPEQTSGIFRWKGKDYMIKSGENKPIV
ncbi:alpha-L-rhamnosidase C-terminal domain-containing protein [Mucilaginibacter sabulilitoris]|uniref:Alpha-L-rhamnosidase C-terminal domain-containing protein n=1 Tax=Mucilaginibacter sabulilitoris TaxID=1173583 RepID=A0ABZ0TPA1_9SPHI|nr:alpha-L-rhamnosidase C-terminal domain-containing protein [Mucilaginibacter sabulilitoris]WPU94918.1 alpha-L-rhamnosidase C-terminal domain-containing protein [Mucilaginibacter sabulilitoris]